MPTVQVVMMGAPLGNTDLYHSLSNVSVGEASITTEVPLRIIQMMQLIASQSKY